VSAKNAINYIENQICTQVAGILEAFSMDLLSMNKRKKIFYKKKYIIQIVFRNFEISFLNEFNFCYLYLFLIEIDI